MKKKLGYFFIVICISLMVLYLFRYKRALIIEDKIPSIATEVVHINLRQIEHHLFVDAIKNPMKYINFKTKKKGVLSLRKTITIPRNLLFFTNTSSLKDVWVSSFISIEDGTKLKSYLLQEGFEESISERLIFFKKDKLVVGIANNKLVIVYQKRQNQTVVTAIQAVFNEVSFYDKNTDLMKSISSSESDISYTNVRADFLEADFKKGLFEIKGRLHSDLFKASMYTEHAENSIGFIGAKVNRAHTTFQSFLSDKNKTKFDHFTKLSIDSIISKWNGRLIFNLKSVDQKMDTIVIYEYDDDFNKIEKQSIQELVIPEMAIEIGSQVDLYEYLKKNRAVQIIENDTLFTSVPLYKMYARERNNGLHIFTQKQFAINSPKEEQFKLKAYLDIHRYLENPLEFSLLQNNNKYLRLLKDASVKFTTSDGLLAQLRLQNNSRNFLSQFIKP